MVNIITLSDILEYVGVGVRPITEGEQVFSAGHVIMCGKTLNENTIVALCLQTSGLTDKPHKIDIVLHADYREWMCVCTCKAGAGRKCKHIVAVLLHLNRLSINDLSAVSCTELEQAWGKRKDSDKAMEVVPLDQFCHHTRQPSDSAFPVAPNFLENFMNNCLEAVPNSEAACHLEGRSTEMEDEVEIQMPNLNSELGNALRRHLSRKWSISFPPINLSSSTLEFYKKEISVTLNDAINLALNTVTQSSNDLWHSQRKLRITASRCYELFTYTRNSNPSWQKKVHSIINSKFNGDANTRYGNEQEKNAITAYETAKDCKVYKCGLVIHPLVPWLGVSPDGLILDGNSIKKIIEIKCPVKGSLRSIQDLVEANEIPYLCISGEELCLKKKHKFYGQVQLAMGLLQIEECDFVVYSSFSESYVCITVVFDNEFVVELLNSLHYVYFVHYITALRE